MTKATYYQVIVMLVQFTSTACFAQKEATNWIIADSAQISFTDSSSTVIRNVTNMQAPQGSAVQSDSTGRLLFYTNGEEIRNKDYSIMLNGANLLGSRNSSQSAIVVRDPGNPNRYYVFTTSGIRPGDEGLYYNVIDMRLDNNHGAVVSKNIFLMATAEEKLTAAFHTNNKDSWIFTFKSGQVYAYHISATGISGPIVSGAGLADQDDVTGVMKVSPDGTMLAIARTDVLPGEAIPKSIVELYELNRATGQVSNLVAIDKFPEGSAICPYLYGLSFSPSSKILYVSNYIPSHINSAVNLIAFWGIDLLDNNRVGEGIGFQGFPENFQGGGLQHSPNGDLHWSFGRFASGLIKCPDDPLNNGDVLFTFGFTNLNAQGFPNFNEMIFGNIARYAGPDLEVCSNRPLKLQSLIKQGATYQWQPALNLDNSNIAQPIFTSLNIANEPVSYKYVVTVQIPGCNMNYVRTDTVIITVKPPMPAAVVHGDHHICSTSLSSHVYYVDSLPGYRYKWSITGGEFVGGTEGRKIVNWYAAAPIHSLRVESLDNYSCDATHSVFPVSIENLKLPVVQGSVSVCPNVQGVAYWLANKEQFVSQTWQTTGGTINGSNAIDTLQVNWGVTNDMALVKVDAIDNYGCPSFGLLAVRINQQIKPELPVGQDLICNNRRFANAYSVYNRPGSVYTWSTSSGNVVAIQGLYKVVIEWPAPGDFYVWVNEVSTTIDNICFGFSDSLKVKVYQDTSSLTLQQVSVKLDEPSTIQLLLEAQFSTFSKLAIESKLSSDTDWAILDSVAVNEFAHEDINLPTDSLIYNYRLSANNGCGEHLVSSEQSNIVLKVRNNLQDTIYIDWNPYLGWPNGVQSYELYRKLEIGGGITNYSLFATIPGDQTHYVTPSGAQGFHHEFFVLAHERNSDAYSYSNSCEIDFKHLIYPPNVFTPNNDGYNDTFIIHKLELYPNNTFSVWNRYGVLVFRKNNYKGDWSGNGLSPGQYFYQLLVVGKQGVIKGFVSILR